MNKKRTFSEMDNDQEASVNVDNDKNMQIESNPNEESAEAKNNIQPIPFRYDNQQYPAALITKIALLVFAKQNAIKSEAEQPLKLQYDIVEYLCKIGYVFHLSFTKNNQSSNDYTKLEFAFHAFGSFAINSNAFQRNQTAKN